MNHIPHVTSWHKLGTGFAPFINVCACVSLKIQPRRWPQAWACLCTGHQVTTRQYNWYWIFLHLGKFELHKLHQSKSSKSPTFYLHMKNRKHTGFAAGVGRSYPHRRKLSNKESTSFASQGTRPKQNNFIKAQVLKCFTLLNTSSKSTKRLAQGNAICKQSVSVRMHACAHMCVRAGVAWLSGMACLRGWVGGGGLGVCVWVGTVKKLKTVLPVETEFVYLKQESRLFWFPKPMASIRSRISTLPDDFVFLRNLSWKRFLESAFLSSSFRKFATDPFHLQFDFQTS